VLDRTASQLDEDQLRLLLKSSIIVVQAHESPTFREKSDALPRDHCMAVHGSYFAFRCAFVHNRQNEACVDKRT
jgi:hypothetical protein